MLQNVFSHVTDPIDQVSLALTSKHLLQTSSSLVMEIPSVEKLGDVQTLLCDTVDALMGGTPLLDVLGEPRDLSAPCRKCLQHRPAERSHWEEERERFALMEPTRTDVWEVWNMVVIAWAIRYTPVCPACMLDGRKELEAKRDSQPDVPGIASLPEESGQ